MAAKSGNGNGQERREAAVLAIAVGRSLRAAARDGP